METIVYEGGAEGLLTLEETWKTEHDVDEPGYVSVPRCLVAASESPPAYLEARGEEETLSPHIPK